VVSSFEAALAVLLRCGSQPIRVSRPISIALTLYFKHGVFAVVGDIEWL